MVTDHLAASVESCCQNFHRGVTWVSEGRFGLPHCFCYTWNMFTPGGDGNRRPLEVLADGLVVPTQMTGQKGFGHREETEIVLRSRKAGIGGSVGRPVAVFCQKLGEPAV